MQTKLLLLIACCFCIINTASARIGETFDELVSRFGKPTWETKDYEQPAYDFRKGDYSVHVNLLDGRSANEEYWVSPGLNRSMSQADVDLILSANSQNSQWKTVDSLDLFDRTLRKRQAAWEEGDYDPMGSPKSFTNAWSLEGRDIIAYQVQNPVSKQLRLAITTKKWDTYTTTLVKAARENALKESGL